MESQNDIHPMVMIFDTAISLDCLVYGDREGNIWVGTNYESLILFDKKTEKFIPYKHNPHNNNSISNG